MLKVSNKFSVNLSIVVAVLFLIVCVFGAFIMPTLANTLIDAKDSIGSRVDITHGGRIFVIVIAYFALFFLALADGLLLALLNRVKKALVFTEKSVSLIRGVSWCCVFIGMAFCLLGIYFQLAFFVAFFAAFLAICLRVVKNVIEQATIIKSENDLTV